MTLPSHIRSQRESLNKAFPQFTFAVLPKKLFIYRKGAQTPFLVFDRDNQYYKHEDKTVTSLREALEWANTRKP